MKIEKQLLIKIYEIFEKEKKEKRDMVFRNSFALACDLSVEGKDRAGKNFLKVFLIILVGIVIKSILAILLIH